MTATPKMRDDVVFRPVGTEWVAYDPPAGELHVLNVTAALVFEMCDGETTPDQMVEVLRDTLTDAPEDEALRAHVDQALADFGTKGLLA